jgi:hypothetical protein
MSTQTNSERVTRSPWCHDTVTIASKNGVLAGQNSVLAGQNPVLYSQNTVL